MLRVSSLLAVSWVWGVWWVLAWCCVYPPSPLASLSPRLPIPSAYADRSGDGGREEARHPNPHAKHKPHQHIEPLKQHALQHLEPLDEAQVAHAEQDVEAEAADVEEAEAAQEEEASHGHVPQPSQPSQPSDATKRRTSKKKKGGVAASAPPPAPLNAAAVDFVPVLAGVFNGAALLAPPLLDHT